MKEYLALFVSFLIGVTAHHEVHLVPAHKICPDVNGDHDILLPDPRDCSVYYRCENGTAIPQSCPPGLAWCQILQNCTLPILANCTLSHTIVTYSPEQLATYNPNTTTTTGPTTSLETCPKDGVTLPYPEDCTKYYKCVKGKPHSEHCSGKQRYSTWLGICTAPEIANCINVGTQENKTCPVNGAKNVYPTDCSKYYECVGNTVEIKQCPSGEEYNEWFKDCYSSDLAYCHLYSTLSPTTLPTTIQTPGPDNTCPGSGYKLPNPLNCTTYFLCENNNPTLQNCPAGFEYSCWEQECLPPSESQCLATQGQSCKNSGEKLPNSQDCHSYFECTNGTTEKKECKKDLEYNAWFKQCVHANVAHCKVEETTSPTTPTNPPHTPSPGPIDICPIDGAKLPDPFDCHSYYICKKETPVQEKCPQDLEYSCWDQQCLPAESADCIINSNQTGLSCKTENTTMPNINDCSSYYKCKNGKVVLENCDNGLEFNAWFGKCVKSSISHCKSTTENPQTTPNSSGTPSLLCPMSGLKYPSTKYCNAYMICDSNRQLKTVECNPSTFHYNCEKKECENTTHCCSSSTLTMPPPTETISGNPSETTHSTGSESTGNPNETTPSTGSESTGNPNETTHSTGSESTSNPNETTHSTGTESTGNPNETTHSTGSESTGNPNETTPSTGSESTGNPNETTHSTGSESTSNPNETTHSTGTESTGNPNETTHSTSSENTGNPNETTHSTGSESTSNPNETTYSTANKSTANPNETTHSTGSESTSNPNETTYSTASESTGNPNETTHSTGTESTDNPNETTHSTGSESTSNLNETTYSTASESTGNPNETTHSTASENTGNPNETTHSTSSESTGNPNETTHSTASESTGNPNETTHSTGTESTDNPNETTYSTASESTGNPNETTHSTASESTGNPNETTHSTSSESTGNPNETTHSTASESTGNPNETTHSTGTESTDNPNETTHSTGSESTGNPNETTHSTGSESTGSPNETTHSTSSESTGSPNETTHSTGSESTGSPNETTHSTASESTGNPNETTQSTGSESTSNPNETTHSTGSESTGNPNETTHSTASESTGNQNETTHSTGSESTGNSNETTNSTGSENTSIETTPSVPLNPLCPEPNILYPSYTKCNAYMKCNSHLQLETITCDPSTFNYNCESKTCENITHCCAPGANTTTSPTTITTTPTPSPIDDVCPSDGAKLPNPIDCTSYFVCRNNTPVSQHCPPGQEYSCWDQQCEDPKDAVCIDNSQPGKPCSQNNEKLPNIGDCGSYYQCVKGIIELKKCDSGKLFNKWFKKCVPYAISHCEVYPTSPGSGTPTTISPSPTQNVCPFEGAQLPNPLNCSTYFVCLNNEPSLESCPAGQAYSCWDQQCQSSAVAHCITDSHPGDSCSINNLHLPNIEDCRSYYICQNGSIVSTKCPANTQFNSWFQKCVKTQYAHCQSSTTSSSTPTTITTPKTTTSPSVSDDICPIDGAKLPNPLDCSSYFICINETAQKQQCPSGQEYSCWDQKCEKPENSTCIKEGSQEGQQCSIDGNQQQNVEDCGSYYECVHGKIKLKQCSKGKFYNKWFKKCLQFQYAHCKTSPTIKPPYPTLAPPTTVSPSTTEDICPFEGALLPNPLNCSTYFTCINNEPTLQSCPNGQGYSCWDQQCESGALDKCNPNGEEGQSCSIEGIILPNSGDCESYLECINGTIVNKSCEAGTEYNSWYTKCVESQYSHCQSQSTTNSTDITTTKHPDTCPLNGAILPNPLDCNSYFTCENEEIVTKHCPAGEIYSCWDQKCESPGNATCINEGNQQGHHCSIEGTLLPIIDSCNKYYQCNGGKIKVKVCASGKIYSKWLKRCVSIGAEICITYTTQPPITTPPGPTDPTAPSEGNNVCPLEGALIPNPFDCATYYKCINGTPTLEKCLDGNKYSCWDQRCETDTEATCVSEGGQTGQNCSVEGLRIADISNCNNYYECHNGKIILKHCPNGQEFNANFQKCYKHELAHCRKQTTITPKPATTPTTPPPTISPYKDLCPKDGALLPNPLNCSAYYKCINGTPTPQLCAAGDEYSCWDQMCEPIGEAQCIMDGVKINTTCKHNGEQLQNPEDCHSYYECEKGKIQLKRCALHWYYNKWFHICVPFEILSHCKPTNVTKPQPPITTQAPIISNDICPIDGAFLPNPVDCSGYYKCENSKPTPQKCPSGQEYSCWDQKCEAASDAQCINADVHPGQNCSQDGVRLQDLESCSSYYECQNGKVEKEYCFFGSEYNRWYQKCVLFPYAHCKSYPINKTITPKPSTTPSVELINDICPIDGALLPDPLDCSRYYKCVNTTPTPQNCPSGQEYSCWDQKCEAAKDAQCINAGVHAGQNCSQDGVKLQNVESCSSYFECENGKVQKKYCFIGRYNRWYNRCVLPPYDHCKTSSTITPTTTTSTPNTSPTKLTTRSPLCPINGLKYPSTTPGDCGGYLLCIDYKPVRQQCPFNKPTYNCESKECEFQLFPHCCAPPRG